MFKKIAAAAFALTIAIVGHSQLVTNKTELLKTADDQKQKVLQNYEATLTMAKAKGWSLTFATPSGDVARLVGMDEFQRPVYYITQSNLVAAATTGANQLWVGGSSGLNLTGGSLSVKGKVGIWDGGKVRADHQELTGRISQIDAPSSFSDHSTHVAGTIMASGVNPNAKGMSYALQELLCWDFNNDVPEIAAAAPNFILSNHSYGTGNIGWIYNSSQARWEFWGAPGDNEDYRFGYYDSYSQIIDSIAYNAPFYLMVKAAGNSRDEKGPAVGSTYWRLDANGQMVNAGPRPPGMSSHDSYDGISDFGNSKNVLTVGAVNGIPAGYSNPNDVVMSSFSCWGPTDDGRIKPDVVADGVAVQSSTAAGTNTYGVFSGTSMATPNATGSLVLLQEYYAQLHPGNFMRAATLKGIAIHCADEAGGAPGPDYSFGWGLLNVAKGAQVIKSNNAQSHQIFENVLNNGATYTMNIIASGPITATISWTDVKGNVSAPSVNNPIRKLINDLDIRITQAGNTYYPWKLDPANPSAAATTGDNDRDNVERINIPNAVVGLAYTITITHKGTLARGSQAYSLILSGVNGQSYCASAAASTAGARIDSVSFGSIHQKNPASCTSYSDFTSSSANVEPGQTLPIAVKVNACDATTADKMVKVFIDYNNNGLFTDAGETVATSGVINGNGTFNGNITLSSNLIVNTQTVMRIITQETNNPNDIVPCGSYAKGETQDYKLAIVTPSFDFKVDSITNPANPSCLPGNHYVTIKIKNTGAAAQSGIPVALEIKSGSATVLSVTGTYGGSIPVGESRYYTFTTPFSFTAGSTYSVATYITGAVDQFKGNDTIKTNLVMSAAGTAPTGGGEVCGNQSILLADVSYPTYAWYIDQNANPIAGGDVVHSPAISPNNTYYIGKGARSTLGLASKAAFPSGGGYISGSTGGYMKYSSGIPLTLETMKLYSKYPGSIELIVGDIIDQSGSTFTYTTISSMTLDIYASTPNQAPGNVNGYDAADTGAVYFVNLTLPSGNHAIIAKPIGNTNLFRSNNVTGSPYPFGYSEYIALTGNSAGTEGGTAQNYYYFFYDMRLKTNDCYTNRGTVVATVATKPTITRNGNVLTSSNQFGNQWKLNGTAISGANGTSYTPVQTGNYTTTTSDAYGCQLTSDVYSFYFTAVDPVTVSSTEVTLSPNPTNGIFTVKYKAERKEDLKVEIVNAKGQTVVSKSYGSFAGNFSDQFQLKKASGVYVLKIQHGNKVVYKKLIVE